MGCGPVRAVGWKRLKRVARLRLELSQRRAHPFLSVEAEMEFVLAQFSACRRLFRSWDFPLAICAAESRAPLRE
jgi:hypothetical protein